MTNPVALDVVIIGGGASGLWLLDELVRRGRRVVLLEANELGSGQTIASQGIIHGGLKYSLSGILTPSARAIREMPTIWRRCLAGEMQPDLRQTRLRAEFCYLWRTERVRSRLAYAGARMGLNVRPTPVPENARPSILSSCRGQISRLDEQVIEPASFLSTLLDRYPGRILQINAAHGLEFECPAKGQVSLIRLLNPSTGEPLDLQAQHTVFTAGAGNARLREQVQLDPQIMQRRPLHMVAVRGRDLPVLNGHCVDGSATRLTITSSRDWKDRTVWQIGGAVAELGVDMDTHQLVQFAREEVRACLPDVDFSDSQWSTYRADRAEPVTARGMRPEGAHLSCDGNVLTAWPTKLALVPALVQQIIMAMGLPEGGPALPDSGPQYSSAWTHWPRPVVALPPWEEDVTWLDA